MLKLLLRTLDDRNQSSARSHHSSQIRGYSRQTESYVSSLSNSADNSADEGDYDEEWSGDSSFQHNHMDGACSRTMSLPAHLGEGQYRSKVTTDLQQAKICPTSYHYHITNVGLIGPAKLILQKDRQTFP